MDAALLSSGSGAWSPNKDENREEEEDQDGWCATKHSAAYGNDATAKEKKAVLSAHEASLWWRWQCVQSYMTAFGMLLLVGLLIFIVLAILPIMLPTYPALGIRFKDWEYYVPVKGHTCLDGSRGGFWIELSKTNSKNWYVHLNGGGWSYTESAMRIRSRMYFGNSARYAWVKRTPTILDSGGPKPPEFDSWNKVFFPYCSGDMYVGRNTTSHWKVNGYANFWSNIHLLNSTFGMHDADTIILAGNSAGAGGVLFHIDEFADAFPDKRVIGNPQSYMFPDIPVYNRSDARTDDDVPYTDYGDSLLKVPQAYKQMFDAWIPTLPHACVDDHKDDPYWCFSPTVMYKYIKTPLFVITALTDYAFMSWYKRWPNVYPFPAVDTPAGKYALQWASMTRDIIDTEVLRNRTDDTTPTNGVIAFSCVLVRLLRCICLISPMKGAYSKAVYPQTESDSFAFLCVCFSPFPIVAHICVVLSVFVILSSPLSIQHDGYTNNLTVDGVGLATALWRYATDYDVGHFNHTFIDDCGKGKAPYPPCNPACIGMKPDIFF